MADHSEDLGELRHTFSPKEKPPTPLKSKIMFQWMPIVIGIGALVFGLVSDFTLGLVLGPFILLTGLAVWVIPYIPFLNPNIEVQLYNNGIVVVTNDEPDTYLWSEVTETRLSEWYDDRFSPLTYNIRFDAAENRFALFNSADIEDGERLVSFLNENAPNVQAVPFQS